MFRGLFKKKTQKPDLVGPPKGLGAGRRIYAIGDVHGHLDLLTALEGLIEKDLHEAPINELFVVYLGDYIDRGPNSAGVIEHLVHGGTLPGQKIFLRGNHEAAFLRYLSEPELIREWRNYGALEAIASYNVDVFKELRSGADALHKAFLERFPASHRSFIEATTNSFALDGYFFCHAGVRPGLPLEAQSEADLLWIRNDFLNHSGAFERCIVHGHTPVEAPQHLRNRINVDTGAYMTGQLTAVVLEGSAVRFLTARRQAY